VGASLSHSRVVDRARESIRFRPRSTLNDHFPVPARNPALDPGACLHSRLPRPVLGQTGPTVKIGVSRFVCRLALGTGLMLALAPVLAVTTSTPAVADTGGCHYSSKPCECSPYVASGSCPWPRTEMATGVPTTTVVGQFQ
jgi:hypothetical protein